MKPFDTFATGNADGNPAIRIRRRLGFPMFVLALLLCLPMLAGAQDSGTIDPSGGWKSRDGELSLMLTGDALSFSYFSVFGATAHICDGAGVAGLVTDGEYQYVDDLGTVSFLVSGNEVKMRLVKGMVSFCGANWPGEVFTREGFESLTRCKVVSPKAYFHVVMHCPPEKRKAYVIKGDMVEVAPFRQEGCDDWVLARFKGSKAATVGLLRKDALKCPK